MRLAGRLGAFREAGEALMPRGISRLDWSSDEVMRACLPAANGLFTARSLARMYAALAAGGSLDGVRLMSPRTVRRATAVQTTERDRVLKLRMSWRMGYHRVATTRGVPRAAFGHFGYGGSGGWACPEHRLAVALVVNAGAGTPLGDLRILQVSGAALAAASRSR